MEHMTWEFSFRDAPPLITVKVRGKFTIAECRLAIAELIDRKEPGWPVLFDDREVDFSEVSSTDLIEMSSMLASNKNNFAFAKIGVLVSFDADMDIADKWRQISRQNTIAGIKVFFDEDEAISWLAR